MKPQFADEEEAEKEAKLQASKLAKGLVDASELTAADRQELVAIRRVCNGTPALSAIQEWAKARDITGGHVIAAAEAFAARSTTKFNHITAEKCVEEFIQSQEKLGKAAERTYRSKLTPIGTYFPGRHLDTIATPEWQAYLGQRENGVTRNDFRKRAITMCLWARKQGYLPRGVDVEAANTDRAPEANPSVGIIKPDTYGRLLVYLLKYHPHYLAAAVIAGQTGMRTEEIHGKRAQKDGQRQLWEDIHLDKFIVTVTNAKKNTPSWRNALLSRAAVEWLRLCPEPQKGPICDPNAIERIRDIGRSAGLKLPDNCFRHSYISYKLTTSHKQMVADWAGTSSKQIDKHYKRPVLAETGECVELDRDQPITKRLGRQWFNLTPEIAESLPDQLHPSSTKQPAL